MNVTNDEPTEQHQNKCTEKLSPVVVIERCTPKSTLTKATLNQRHSIHTTRKVKRKGLEDLKNSYVRDLENYLNGIAPEMQMNVAKINNFNNK